MLSFLPFSFLLMYSVSICCCFLFSFPVFVWLCLCFSVCLLFPSPFHPPPSLSPSRSRFHSWRSLPKSSVQDSLCCSSAGQDVNFLLHFLSCSFLVFPSFSFSYFLASCLPLLPCSSTTVFILFILISTFVFPWFILSPF